MSFLLKRHLITAWCQWVLVAYHKRNLHHKYLRVHGVLYTEQPMRIHQPSFLPILVPPPCVTLCSTMEARLSAASVANSLVKDWGLCSTAIDQVKDLLRHKSRWGLHQYQLAVQLSGSLHTTVGTSSLVKIQKDHDEFIILYNWGCNKFFIVVVGKTVVETPVNPLGYLTACVFPWKVDLNWFTAGNRQTIRPENCDKSRQCQRSQELRKSYFTPPFLSPTAVSLVKVSMTVTQVCLGLTFSYKVSMADPKKLKVQLNTQSFLQWFPTKTLFLHLLK